MEGIISYGEKKKKDKLFFVHSAEDMGKNSLSKLWWCAYIFAVSK